MALTEPTLASLLTDGLPSVDPEIAAALRRRARAPARPARADRVRELHLAGRCSRRSARCSPTSTPRACPASATTAAARSSTRSSSWPSSAPSRCSAPSTRTSSRTPAPRPTWPPTPRCSSRATPSSGMKLDHGGHLTHGLQVNFSGKLYRFDHYGVSRETETDRLRRGARAVAHEHRPKLIVAGGSAYPREIDARRFREIADEVERTADGRHGPLLGPRRGRRSTRTRSSRRTSSPRRRTRRSPGRARASCCARRSSPRRSTAPSSRACRAGRCATSRRPRRSASRSPPPRPSATTRRQVVANAKAMAEGLAEVGERVLTRRHRHAPGAARPAPLRVHRQGRRGAAGARCCITVNRNTVPFDERPPTVASGVRIGTPAATMRGLDADDSREVGRIVGEAVKPAADLRRAGRAHARDPATAARSTRACAPGTRWCAPLRGEPARRRRARPPDRPGQGHAAARPLPPTCRRSAAWSTRSRCSWPTRPPATSETEPVEVETPLERTRGPRSAGPTASRVVPVLRAGLGMLDGALQLLPAAAGRLRRRVPRGGRRCGPVPYFLKLPAGRGARDVLLLDPMVATGGSAAYAVADVQAGRRRRGRPLVALIAAPEGIAAGARRPPRRARSTRRRSTAS